MCRTTRRQSRVVVGLIAAGIIGSAGATALQTRTAHAAPADATQSAGLDAATSSNAPAPFATGTIEAPDFTRIVDRFGPAVVNISVTSTRSASDEEADPASAQGGIPGLDPDDPFYQFFRHFQGPNMPGQGGGRAPEQQTVRGLGSGFIVSSDGLILTNAHVVRGAKEVIVKLTDRREFAAKVLGFDKRTDIAVLRIAAKNLPTVPLGKAKDLKVGEWVLAIGSPFGFENTVTAGVVSAKHRSLPDDSFVPFIQTDVAVNPGNSGGPLFNTRGEVIGINSQIYSRSGGYQGVSFSIPIELAMRVEQQIVEHGKATHARLGVVIQEVNQTLADSFGLPSPAGALVSNVDPGGPGAKAGLKSGDVIQSVDGTKIVTSGDLPAIIGEAMPGTQVRLGVWRDGKAQDLSARLANLDDKEAKRAGSDAALDKSKLGLALRPLEPQERQQAHIADGLLIEGVGGKAELAGVQPGDVLLAVNGTSVKTVEQVRALVAKADKSIALLIERNGDKIFVPVRIG
ncbi:MAG: DegQ family serine endoprotease [Lautropia sp.]